jgi:hypothetical protein
VLAQTCEPCEVMCTQSVAWQERSVGTSSDRRFSGTRSSRIPGQVGPWPPPSFLASALSITFSDMLRAARQPSGGRVTFLSTLLRLMTLALGQDWASFQLQ